MKRPTSSSHSSATRSTSCSPWNAGGRPTSGRGGSTKPSPARSCDENTRGVTSPPRLRDLPPSPYDSGGDQVRGAFGDRVDGGVGVGGRNGASAGRRRDASAVRSPAPAARRDRDAGAVRRGPQPLIAPASTPLKKKRWSRAK